MYKKVTLIGVFVFLSMETIFGQTFQPYHGFDITEEGGVPKIFVYGNNRAEPLYKLPIVDGSLLTEFVMARLINSRTVFASIAYQNTPEKFWFQYRNYSENKVSNLDWICFYHDGAGGIVLDVKLTSTAPKTFTLTPSDPPSKKLKFEYIISALVDFYRTDDSFGIDILTDGLKFRMY
jgi:hypothetical protein